MKKYVRSFAYIAAMGFFLILPSSCDSEYDPSEGGFDDCGWLQPQISVKHQVFIKVIDRKTNLPISQASVKHYILENIVLEGDGGNGFKCGLFLKDGIIKKTLTGSDGISYLSIDRVYTASRENTEIIVEITKEGYGATMRHGFHFSSGSNVRRKDIYLLPIELYP